MYLVSILDSGDERILRTSSVSITNDIVILMIDDKPLSFPLFNLIDIVARDGIRLVEMMTRAGERRKKSQAVMIVEDFE